MWLIIGVKSFPL